MKHIAAALLGLICNLPMIALADSLTLGDITIQHPYSFDTPVTARVGAGYMTLTNNSASDDVLLSVQADFPRVEIHQTQMDGDVAKMTHLKDGLLIPAGSTIDLSPGGTHVMFMGLNGNPFVIGQTVAATLVFEKAGKIDVSFAITSRTADGVHDHTDH